MACDACGCRWFDRMRGTCYECGSEVSAESLAEFQRALQAFASRDRTGSSGAPRPPLEPG